MTRLKDALEKAAHAEAAGDGPRPGQFLHVPQVVPDAWQFDGDQIAEAAAIDSLRGDAEVAEPYDVELRLDDPRDARRPAPPSRKDFWAAYQFGERGMGKVVVAPKADHGLVEQYRRLGAALHHHQLQTGARSLMVTSAAAAEGKTLTASNLALTLSHSYERRVLLVDADLRRPNVHEIFMIGNTTGLSEMLRNPEAPAPVYQAITPTLSILTAGRPDSDPMAGLVSHTMNRLLAEATKQFDWVIVDTPPVALLPDANLLAAMVDSGLLVIGANSTPYPLIRRAIDAIGEQKILGVVLNRMATADIVAGYYYGYGRYAGGAAKPLWRRLLFWKKPGADVALKPEVTAS